MKEYICRCDICLQSINDDNTGCKLSTRGFEFVDICDCCMDKIDSLINETINQIRHSNGVFNESKNNQLEDNCII